MINRRLVFNKHITDIRRGPLQGI